MSTSIIIGSNYPNFRKTRNCGYVSLAAVQVVEYFSSEIVVLTEKFILKGNHEERSAVTLS